MSLALPAPPLPPDCAAALPELPAPPAPPPPLPDVPGEVVPPGNPVSIKPAYEFRTDAPVVFPFAAPPPEPPAKLPTLETAAEIIAPPGKAPPNKEAPCDNAPPAACRPAFTFSPKATLSLDDNSLMLLSDVLTRYPSLDGNKTTHPSSTSVIFIFPEFTFSPKVAP